MNTVTFPGLGLEFTIDPVAFSIGTFQIYWYGVIIALGFFLGVSFCCWQAKKFGLKPDDILDMILFAAPGGIIGARIYYIVFNPGLYLNDDGSLNIMACLDIHRGGLAIYGGIIAGVIIGTLVGGSSTVGTAQLAYNYGMAAWWFTLGGGIACLILALGYVGPLRRQGCPTLVGMIRKEYGDGAGMAASILNSVGTFINIISQLISATAVIAVLFPDMGVVPELIISAAFMVLYVVFGGTKGAGMVGVVKTILLYVSMLGCAGVVLALVGGVGPFADMVHNIDNPEGIHFFSLIARGAGEDIGAGLSLVLGVLTTQTYAQAVLSGKTDGALYCLPSSSRPLEWEASWWVSICGPTPPSTPASPPRPP